MKIKNIGIISMIRISHQGPRYSKPLEHPGNEKQWNNQISWLIYLTIHILHHIDNKKVLTAIIISLFCHTWHCEYTPVCGWDQTLTWKRYYKFTCTLISSWVLGYNVSQSRRNAKDHERNAVVKAISLPALLLSFPEPLSLRHRHVYIPRYRACPN